MRGVLIASFGSAFAIAFVLVLVVRRAALRMGFVDHPAGRKQHERPMPLGGGIAIAAGVCLPVLGAAVLSYLWARDPSLFHVPEHLHAAVRGAASQLRLVLCVLGGGAAMLAFGLWDDVKSFSPRQKLSVQFVIAGAVALVPELRVTLFLHAPWAHMLITTVWIVLLTNSFNLLDNMDGQSGVIAFVTGAALLVLALQTGQYFVAGLLLALCGAVLAFLVFNLPPASIFMGDAGSLFVGYVLAVATVLSTFLTPEQVNPIFPVLVPLVVFAIPIYDSLSVMVIRFHQGRSLLKGDRSHFSHRLMGLGMSDRMILVTVGLLAAATAAGATIPYGSSTWQAVVPALQALALVVVIIQLELVSGRRRNSGRDG